MPRKPSSDIAPIVMWTVLALAVVAFSISMRSTVLHLYTEAQCLDAGYPESRVAWDGERYCIERGGTVMHIESLTETKR